MPVTVIMRFAIFAAGFAVAHARLEFLTFYGGSLSDRAAAGAVPAGRRWLVGGPGVFQRGNWSFASGGLDNHWQATTATWCAAVRPLVANGTVTAVQLGDELVCSGVPLANLSSVAQHIRTAIPNGLKIYTNECGGVLNNGTLAGCYGTECRPEWAWPSVPAALDWIGVDAYDEGNLFARGPLSEVAIARRRYDGTVFPRLRAHQRVVLVPGVFANSPAGCRAKGVACPLASQSAVVVAKLEGYAAWAADEPRIAGMNAWHLMNRTANQYHLPFDQRLGAVAMPDVVRALRAIGRGIVNRTGGMEWVGD